MAAASPVPATAAATAAAPAAKRPPPAAWPDSTANKRPKNAELLHNAVRGPGVSASPSDDVRSRDPRLAKVTTPASHLPAPRPPFSSPDSNAVAAGGSALVSGNTAAVRDGGGAIVTKADWTKAAIRCARSLRAAREQVRRVLRCGGSVDASDDGELQEERQRRAQQVTNRYSTIYQILPADWIDRKIIVNSGAELPRHSLWCGAEVPWHSDDQIATASAFAGRPSKCMAALLRGEAPFRLWIGPVDGGSETEGVVALEDIPAGSWVLPAVVEYVFGQDELSPLVLDFAAEGQDGCVVPRTAVATAEQAAQYEAAERLAPGLLCLPDAGLDYRRHGGAATMLRESNGDPNLGFQAVDLMTGPTTIFYFAARDIKKGEELTRM
jgi:hypothetical protein